ncbi:MAG: radical SAM peptide maturase [bacterium]|nr:radical SAM peptide maturase [bacterium]
MDKRSLLITSDRENHYLVATAVSQILLLHPILKEIVEYELDGGDFAGLLAQAKDKNDPSLLPIPRDMFSSLGEVRYYYDYYLFLKENNYFGQFSKHELTDSRYTAGDIQYRLAGSSHLSFEVTDRCNLDCAYCCYGPLYDGYDRRSNKNMTFATARNIIDYWLELRRKRRDIPAADQVNIGFYGGEPLENFSFIQQVTAYVKENLESTTQLGFSMTSNGTLLDKYMDFLVEHYIQLLISLDGDFEHNKYRVYKTGGFTFDDICRNVDLLRKKYPEYYREKVSFNAILHSLNNRPKVMDFFDRRFGKTPNVTGVSTRDVRDDTRDDFERISRIQEIEKAPDAPKNGGAKKIPIADVFNLRGVVFSHTKYIVRKYAQLLEDNQRKVIVSTGTCAPFSKKIFVTVNGKLLPCERVPQYYSMGTVDETGVHLDYEEVATKYNAFYVKLKNTCNNCYDSHYCSQCIFFLNLKDECVGCEDYKNKAAYTKKLAAGISKMETYPASYKRVFTGFDDRPVRFAGSPAKPHRWLFLHPYVHLNVKKERAVIHNTLNSSLMEYSRQEHPAVLALLKQLHRDENLYVVTLQEEKISGHIEQFIETLRRNFSGDVIAANWSKGKPVQFKPMLKLEDPTNSQQTPAGKSKMKILPGDKLGEYLNTFNLYINETCSLDCDFRSTAYRQFPCCRGKSSRTQGQSITPADVNALCEQLRVTNLLELNLLGGNILLHPDLVSIAETFNYAPFKRNWYIHWRNLAQAAELPESLKGEGNSLHIICPVPVDLELFKNIPNGIPGNGFSAVYHFLLESDDDFSAAEAMVEQFGLEDIELHPLYIRGKNLDFFKDNIFIDRESITESTLNMQDILARGTLNTLNFKQLTMMNDGRVHANVNHPAIGRFPENSIAALIKEELTRGGAWARTRKNVMPCKTCPYQSLCPPISNYEYSMKRYNLCNIYALKSKEED